MGDEERNQKDAPFIHKIPDSIRNSSIFRFVAPRGVPGDGCPLDFLRPSLISAIEVINRHPAANDRQLSPNNGGSKVENALKQSRSADFFTARRF